MADTQPPAAPAANPTNGSGSDSSPARSHEGDKEKDKPEDLETVHTNERVGSHENYYEKGGLRTEGDGLDHVGAHQKVSLKTWGAIVAMMFLWTESQIPLYLFGGVPPEIYGDIGGVDRWIWMVIGNLVSLAAICPFVGALSDLFGRRYLAMIGSVLIIIGMIVCATAANMNNMIAGMTIAGGGAGINELISIAGTAELVPTAKRGPYVALVIFSILPWTPAVMYAQLIHRSSSWRYIGLLCAVWAFAGLVFTALFYWPPPRLNSEGYSKKKTLQRIDWVGGLLSISGALLFLMGLQWGSQQYPYKSTHVLVPLILGGILIICFVLWEWKGAKHPMVPKRLGQNPRVLALTLVITFFSGGSFIGLLFFWPTQAFNVYGNDPVGVGLRGLPIGLGILFGAVLCLVLIGVTKGRIRELMIFFTAVMTAGTGAMSVGEVWNLHTMYGLVVLASIGVGGVIVPCTVITTIICPDDLVATITALTLSIRILGGAVGFTIFYNVFYRKLFPAVTEIVGIKAIAQQLLILDRPLVTKMATLAANAQFAELKNITDGFKYTPYAYPIIIEATQAAMAKAYKWPYYIQIAFGGLSFICACFLGDIKKYMDDHVAVVY
ncbi:hypothetical protein FH972_021285 [Carpinus fangiana]|uniref:Major facilitator superfamily (MFS) profile domain-containing protein n=1 Tax=Carpinus fangiana TaxID=176857 RepID=A0A5N6KNZ0_9ROSI|nr:hypothetical protein FH972_021285 [Carpinus fangiana]